MDCQLLLLLSDHESQDGFYEFDNSSSSSSTDGHANSSSASSQVYAISNLHPQSGQHHESLCAVNNFPPDLNCLFSQVVLMRTTRTTRRTRRTGSLRHQVHNLTQVSTTNHFQKPLWAVNNFPPDLHCLFSQLVLMRTTRTTRRTRRTGSLRQQVHNLTHFTEQPSNISSNKVFQLINFL
jgi:hypothetical protein